ncbi:hypothetical protein RB195_002969 [Necator americanus]|uniref:Uncharacterized protein n=1 Tax=Necator americanus TaxID=51031 RepID=A0ABR1DLH7_NECAM
MSTNTSILRGDKSTYPYEVFHLLKCDAVELGHGMVLIEQSGRMWFVKRAYVTASNLETISRAFAASSKESVSIENDVTNSTVATGGVGTAVCEEEAIFSIRFINSVNICCCALVWFSKMIPGSLPSPSECPLSNSAKQKRAGLLWNLTIGPTELGGPPRVIVSETDFTSNLTGPGVGAGARSVVRPGRKPRLELLSKNRRPQPSALYSADRQLLWLSLQPKTFIEVEEIGE